MGPFLFSPGFPASSPSSPAKPRRPPRCWQSPKCRRAASAGGLHGDRVCFFQRTHAGVGPSFRRFCLGLHANRFDWLIGPKAVVGLLCYLLILLPIQKGTLTHTHSLKHGERPKWILVFPVGFPVNQGEKACRFSTGNEGMTPINCFL